MRLRSGVETLLARGTAVDVAETEAAMQRLAATSAEMVGLCATSRRCDCARC